MAVVFAAPLAVGGVADPTLCVLFLLRVGEAARQLVAAKALVPRRVGGRVDAAVLEARLLRVHQAVALGFARLVAILIGHCQDAQVGEPVVARVSVAVVDGEVAALSGVEGVVDDNVKQKPVSATDGDPGVAVRALGGAQGVQVTASLSRRFTFATVNTL